MYKNKDNNKGINLLFFIRNIVEIIYGKNNNKNNLEIEIIICSKLVFSKYSFDFQNVKNHNNLDYSKTLFIPFNGYFEINKSNNTDYILFGEKGLFHLEKQPFNCDISKIHDMDKYKKDKINYRGGILFNNDDFLALSSNKILPNGEDIITFYDIKNKNIIKKCPNYSFAININNLAVIELNENKKVLLCVCKKYKDDQQNGILLINIDIIENEKMNEKFFNTEEFEVNCFCPLKQIKSGKNYKNNFFLAGGFDVIKNRGIIKLYKILFENEIEIGIEFLQDFFFENVNNEGFRGTINCIVQHKQNGKILVCCLDNKIYIYSKPNIDFYLNE